MRKEASVRALRNHQVERSKRKSLEVLKAVEDLASENSPITVAAVCRVAQVSREFVYSHPVLHEAVVRAARQSKERSAADLPSDTNFMHGLKADRATLLRKIQRQREQIEEQKGQLAAAERQRKLRLGMQLDGEDVLNPAILTELRFSNEKLMTDNTVLTRQISELKRLVAVLESQYAASRQAHAEDLARLSGQKGVIAFGPIKNATNRLM
jgi:hypothetical protein